MTHYLVTGGTGFLGEHVVRQLLSAGHDVRVLARGDSRALASAGAEMVRGDISSGPGLAAALDGVDRVFHLAGLVSRDPDDSLRMMQVHVGGTRRLLRAAKASDIERVVVASSSGTVAVSTEARLFDETDGYATEVAAKWPYYASKIYQEKVALELGEELDLEVVIVNPSLLLGPGDRRLSSTKDVQKFLRGQIPVVPDGGVNFVDVRDAAAATITAMDRGRPGERYLLGGPNWTTREFFGRLSRVAKVGAPRFSMPARVSEVGAGLLEGLFRAAGRKPPIDRASVEMGQHFWYVDSSKAERELDFAQRDPTLTLADTVKYLRRNLED